MVHRFLSSRALRFATAWFLSSLGSATVASAADGAGEWEQMRDIRPRAYVAGLVSTPPVIDGKLDEADWQKAEWTEEFVDIEGDRRPKPLHRTQAKMIWDDQYFYIGAKLDEPHLQGSLTEHDAVIFRDNDFEVFVDPDGDNHRYYEFEINALNTSWDLFLPKPYKDGGPADNGWEIPGLKTAVHLDGTLNNPADVDKGWSVELAIPWTAFNRHAVAGKAPIAGERMRVGFSRVEWKFEVEEGKYVKAANTKEDNWIWSPQGIVDMHRPERWGFVTFVKQAPGSITISQPTELAVRDTLMEIYHRQRVFHAENKEWAASFEQLKFKPKNLPGMKSSRLTSTADGFDAAIVISNATGSDSVWSVRQDSLITQKTSDPAVEAALAEAGENAAELRKALAVIEPEYREGLEFLLVNMPKRDLTGLSASFLVDDVRTAYESWQKSPWFASIPKEIFFNDILPYASINEQRESWRADFRRRFLPLVAEAKSPSEAAALLNQKLYPLVKVRYSTQRPKADQNPYESIKAGTASCTGLSILLIDACRACGVPARFVGTPLWSDGSGNHSWVEIWDKGWHFTGAAEPNGNDLDKAWFIDRASTAKREDRRHAIYAVSFRKTPLKFPLVWDRSIDYVHAVNVTDRYVNKGAVLPKGTAYAMIRVVDPDRSGARVIAEVKVQDAQGKVLFEGRSKDEQFDANDHLAAPLALGTELIMEADLGGRKATVSGKFEKADQLFNIALPPVKTEK
ncbi:MAG: transglutaminase domain-containing protein [Pirellulales bacterium]